MPGVEYSRVWHPSLTDSITDYHLLFGYRTQWNRFVAGVEFNYELDAGKQLFRGFKSPGAFGGTNSASGMNCYEQFLPQIVCVGGSMQGNATVESKRQLRFTGGVLITPDILAYGVYGLAWGKSPNQIGAGAAGFVTNPGDTPLVGAATVTRSGIQSKIKGFTVGGGLEVRANEWLSFRGEYTLERYNWAHAPVGGAGFGGTIGNVTVNSFFGASGEHKITNETYRFSAIVKLGNIPSLLPASE